MASTILSSLGEAVLHSNSLATITDNWVVVRRAESRAQVVMAIDSISAVKTFKTTHFNYLACALGCLVIALATLCSKEADGATVPFALAGTLLLIGAQVTRQASLAFLVDADIIQTAYGTLSEAATLVVTLQLARGRRRRGEHDYFSWLRAYIALLV
jgi:hypothetical protein